jgi:predicted aminopeptidase
VLSASLGGCAQVSYYAQAMHGHYSMLSQARPIDTWLADPATDDKLRGKLVTVQEIRRFAARELGLPDNGSYTRYASLDRPYVLWNVVAAPALSLEPRQSCFPVAGCVDYRGYYDRKDAQAFADELRSQGFDVQIAGVPAYSTLGWFDDPVLSTFIRYPDGEVARLIFHELAHQVAYAKHDSQFNESFAVSVEEAGVERWLQLKGDDALRQAYEQHARRKRDFLALLQTCRDRLAGNYAGNAPDVDKLVRKAEIFQALKDDYQRLKTGWGGYAGYDRWFAEPLSNAHLASIATYHDLVPGFRRLLRRQGSFAAFYGAVKKLAELDEKARHAALGDEEGKTLQVRGGRSVTPP